MKYLSVLYLIIKLIQAFCDIIIHQQNIFFENRTNSSLIDQLAKIAC